MALNWKFDADCQTHWEAESESLPGKFWRITVYEDGMYDLSESDQELFQQLSRSNSTCLSNTSGLLGSMKVRANLADEHLLTDTTNSVD